MTTLELLRLMRAKIATGWTQGCSARNSSGFPVVPYSDDACEWCLIGSMTANKGVFDCSREQFALIRREAYVLLGELLSNRNESMDLAAYNDNKFRTREEVLELVDEAISVASVGGFA